METLLNFIAGDFISDDGQFFLTIYPGSVELRYNGKTPIEFNPSGTFKPSGTYYSESKLFVLDQKLVYFFIRSNSRIIIGESTPWNVVRHNINEIPFQKI